MNALAKSYSLLHVGEVKHLVYDFQSAVCQCAAIGGGGALTQCFHTKSLRTIQKNIVQIVIISNNIESHATLSTCSLQLIVKLTAV